MSDSASQNLSNKVRIRNDLEKFTGPILDRHDNCDDLIATIAALNKSDQDLICHWTEVVGACDKELAAHFVAKAPGAFGHMDQAGVEAWVIEAMDAFDNRGLGFGMEVLDQADRFAAAYINRDTVCLFEQISGFLQPFVKGLGGRELQLAIDSTSYTDTQKIFLPDLIGTFSDAERNFHLYKLVAAHLWAQNWFGTWRFRVVEHLIGIPDLDAVLPIFNRLECIRLDACLERNFPGLYRQMHESGYSAEQQRERWREWRVRAQELIRIGATALDSCRLIDAFRGMAHPKLSLYQREMYPGKVREVLFSRAEQEKATLQQALKELQQELQDGAPVGDPGPDAVACDQGGTGEFSLAEDDPENAGIELKIDLRYNGSSVPTSKELQALLSSIMQDFGEIPEDHLQPTAHGEYPDELASGNAEHLLGPYADQQAKDAISYREWDYVRHRFRENYCILNELEVPPGDEEFVDRTLEKYQGVLKSIKKTFEAVLDESRLERRQSQGDDIDIDALVQAHAEASRGEEMSEYVYTRYRNMDRNIAVMFMVDMSGSTLGWINEAERESLILLCEALETLGDRYAIYGFSGRTNKRCEVHRVKTFTQAYDLGVRQRISGMKAKSYTRMGVAIRHLGHLLNQTYARTKLLIALSDGRPEDYGGYKGRYGIEDTRHALLEIQRDGIHSFCITIDKEAQRYLPYMYGVTNYAVIDEVQKLPYKVADIYRRLTT